ncbi:MAG: DUF2027 domain-containing protein [Bacteroidales bacterium]|jgi:hypothetical protein|nr:DUF2027 domain-containing protein [Bacteroidales bacterium]MDD4217610.1 DUF2027 domain-containing protein [Bacteroidales bacterium]MDY0141934.1 DUF2027 domain-containing protein [Bacteroidales bacterium]
MELSVGDKVRFLNDVGGGKVVKILEKNMVLVQDADEFEYPYPKSELVLVEKAIIETKSPFPENLHFEPKKNVVSPKTTHNVQPELKNDSVTEILFAFLRKKSDDFDGFEAYLINDSNFYMFYHVVLRGDNGFTKLDAEMLEPNTKIAICELSREQINSSKEVIVQAIFYDHPYDTLRQMLERKIKIVPLKFFQEHVFIDSDFFSEKAYVFELLLEKPGLGESIKSEKDFENNLLLKEEHEEDASQKFKARKKPETVEVDLHINQLVDSVIGMSNADILKIQLDLFHKTITEAIMNKAGKVILIHGIGNGTLKAAIRESLTKQYKLQFEDASFKEYGFGATEVVL